MKRIKHKQDEISYWLSFSDLMSGLLIIFILVTIFMVMDLNEATDELNVQAQDTKEKELEYLDLMEEYQELKNELDITKLDLENIVSINDEIITLLKSKLGKSLEIDEDTGAIRLKSDLLFDSGESRLNNRGKEFIRENLPGFFEIIFSEGVKEQISSVIVYGFTDDVGDYEFNLKLSQDRAREVYTFIINDPAFEAYKKDFVDYVVLSGVAQAKYLEQSADETIDEWRSHNRRVEIQFELNFRELFDSIKNKLMVEDL